VAQFPPGCAVRANKDARCAIDRGAQGVGMSEPLDWEDVCSWLELRKSDLCEAWRKAFTEIIGDQSGWSLELRLRLDDAAEKQARAERFACLYGRPIIKSADETLAELLEWRKTGKMSERVDTAEYCLKRLLGEELSDDERKASREAWRRRRTT
jgi:hypothetical protein